MESTSAKLWELARSLGPQLISFAAMLTCVVIAFVRRKRHPKVSLIVALALVLLILHQLLYVIIDIFISPSIVDMGAVAHDTYYWMIGLIASATLALLFTVLLIAIFINRNPVAPKQMN